MIHQIVEQDILTIIIDRPNKKNALIPSMYKEMAIAIENASKSAVRVIIIKGNSGCFTAGNDVKEFAKSTRNKNAEPVNETYRFMQALLHCPLPVIAQVEGLAIGIGSTLLLHCDFVLAHNQAQFAMPFVNLGLVPEYASSYILPRIAGHLAAAEILMLGEAFSAQKALQCGLVSSIHNEDLSDKVKQLALSLAKKPAAALAQTKALMKKHNTDVMQIIDDELKVFADAMQTEQAIEAFDAFLEKRAINYDVFK